MVFEETENVMILVVGAPVLVYSVGLFRVAHSLAIRGWQRECQTFS